MENYYKLYIENMEKLQKNIIDKIKINIENNFCIEHAPKYSNELNEIINNEFNNFKYEKDIFKKEIKKCPRRRASSFSFV